MAVGRMVQYCPAALVWFGLQAQFVQDFVNNSTTLAHTEESKGLCTWLCET